MYPCEDKIADELDPQNQVIIAFLNQVHKAYEERSPVQQEQAIDRVRQRLLALEQEEIIQPAHTLMSLQTGQRKAYAIIEPRTRWPQRIKLLAAIACTVLVIGSTAFAFQRIQQSKLTSSHSIEGTPLRTQRVTVTPMSVQEQAHYLVAQFQQEANTWGSTHLYHNSYDGKDYPLDNAYMPDGVMPESGPPSDIYSSVYAQLSHASTIADFSAVVTRVNAALFNLHMLEANAKDQAPCNAAHQSDTRLLDHYQLTQGRVIVVSLVEQCMRVYQKGALVKSFFTVTGRQGASSPPGVWNIQDRHPEVTFISSWPPSSPDWVPRIRCDYVQKYRPQDFVLASSWRTQYGPGTQFPHADPGIGSSGQVTNNGTYGNIELAEADAGWLYQNTSLSTTLLIY